MTQPVQAAATSHYSNEMTLSQAIDSGNKVEISECIRARKSLESGDFAALCLNYPDLALLALSTYSRSALPENLPERTLKTLCLLPESEELLVKLAEAKMCTLCPTLLHLACEYSYIQLAELLLSQGFDPAVVDELGHSAAYYAAKDDKLSKLIPTSNTENKPK